MNKTNMNKTNMKQLFVEKTFIDWRCSWTRTYAWNGIC